MVKLENISTIHSGQSFRKKISDHTEGDCMVIQMKDLSEDYSRIEGEPVKIPMDEVSDTQLLDPGDILFMAKGNNNFAVTFHLHERAVAASLFFVIRPDRDKVEPEYLVNYLNAPIAQNYFREQRAGGSVANITKATLGMMEIDLPELWIQRTVASVYSLWQRERTTTLQLLEQKDKYYSNLVSSVAAELRPVSKIHDMRVWFNLLMYCNIHRAHIELKHPVSVDGEDLEEIYAVILDMETELRTYDTEEYKGVRQQQVKGWKFVEIKNLRKWRNRELPRIERQKLYERFIEHDKIKQIKLIDHNENLILKQTNE